MSVLLHLGNTTGGILSSLGDGSGDEIINNDGNSGNQPTHNLVLSPEIVKENFRAMGVDRVF